MSSELTELGQEALAAVSTISMFRSKWDHL